jgi:hypothetical protein
VLYCECDADDDHAFSGLVAHRPFPSCRLIRRCGKRAL